MEYLEKVNTTIDKATMINELSLRNQERFEKILKHWEKQTDRLDNLISRLEKNK
jgi:hypothetical protein